MAEVLVLQHAAPEILGTIADPLEARGIGIRYIRLFQGEPVPARMEAAGGLIVMGGPMGVHDHSLFPFLLDEMKLINLALKEGKPVLGVCLGSQLLASVLGARVTRGKQREIGWHPVRLTEEGRKDSLWAGVEPQFTPYHWHSDIFDLPGGAVSLASSDLTPHQAFRHGERAYGLLFHLEVTDHLIREMIRHFSDDLKEERLDAGPLLQDGDGRLSSVAKISQTVFGRWADLLR